MDRVLVEKITPPTKSVGGVLLPETMTGKRANEAVVMAVGPGRRTVSGELVPLDVKSGDTVLLPEFGGEPVKMGEKEYHLFREDEILGIMPPE